MGNGMGGLYAARRRNGDGPVFRQEPPKPRKSPAKKAAAKKSPAKAPSKAPAKKSPAKKSPARARKSTAPKLAAQPGTESNSGGDRRTDQ